MNVLFSDIKTQVADYGQNYTATTIDTGNIARAANRAIEIVQRQLGLPSDKKIFSFYYYNDQQYYDCPDGFNEFLELYYNTSQNPKADNNIPQNAWILSKDTEILRDSALPRFRNRIASTSINGKNQLLLVGRNTNGSLPLNNFDSTSGLTFSSDITSSTIDTYVYQTPSGSLKLNINNTLSATTISFSGLWDIRNAIQLGAVYRMFVNFPVGTSGYFSNIELRLQSSTGNYFTMNTSVQANGTAWTENNFNKISWALANYALVGAPDASMINNITVVLNHSGSYAPVTGIRFDNLYQIIPDYMDCIYYSAYKGTDSTGATPKILLNQDSDIVSFGNYAPDLINPIALKAALILWPQLRSSTEFWQIYKSDYTDHMKLLSRSYPRNRATGSAGQTYIRR